MLVLSLNTRLRLRMTTTRSWKPLARARFNSQYGLFSRYSYFHELLYIYCSSFFWIWKNFHKNQFISSPIAYMKKLVVLTLNFNTFLRDLLVFFYFSGQLLFHLFQKVEDAFRANFYKFRCSWVRTNKKDLMETWKTWNNHKEGVYSVYIVKCMTKEYLKLLMKGEP